MLLLLLHAAAAAATAAAAAATAVALTSLASYFHTVEPSSCTSLHQRSPTINLPLTFFTVQKSKARSSTQMMKMFTNELVNHVPKT